MRELFLVRHAKSDQANVLLKDIDRPLNERGYMDAYFMSNWFLKHHKSPDLILSSTATRALNTALIFARSLEFNMDHFVLNENIYESSVDNLIAIIAEQDKAHQSIMIFFHNPTITEISNKFKGQPLIDNVPTCGIVNLQFKAETWRDIEGESAQLGFFMYPKKFNQTD